MTNSNLKTFDNFYSNLILLILYQLRILAKSIFFYIHDIIYLDSAI